MGHYIYIAQSITSGLFGEVRELKLKEFNVKRKKEVTIKGEKLL